MAVPTPPGRSVTAPPGDLMTCLNSFYAGGFMRPQSQTELHDALFDDEVEAMIRTYSNLQCDDASPQLSLGDVCKAGASMSELEDLVPENRDRNLPLRWCNHIYSSKCKYNVADDGTFHHACKFLHIDRYVRLPLCRRVTEVPNLMEKNMKGLMKEMNKLVNARAQKRLDAASIMSAWKKPEAARVSPFLDTVLEFRALGWVIPEEPDRLVERLEDAPYAKTLNSIVLLVAHVLHYDLAGCQELMFQTVAQVFRVGRDSPVPDTHPDMKTKNVFTERLLEDIVGDVLTSPHAMPLGVNRALSVLEEGSSDEAAPISTGSIAAPAQGQHSTNMSLPPPHCEVVEYDDLHTSFRRRAQTSYLD